MKLREVALQRGMVLEDPASGFVGAVQRTEKSGGMYVVELEDRHGNLRSFPLGPGFWLEGEPIIAAPIAKASAPKRTQTNSGSRVVGNPKARVAKASHIWVEGRHDAELIQHVWGEDLAHEGIAVLMLDGADNLEKTLGHFGPTNTARAGVLLDHMVPGSKETRIAAQVEQQWGHAVRVLGHPYVDVWQAVKPGRVGLPQWPEIPRGTDIKVGTLRALGWPAKSQADIALGWQKILGRVRNYRDLEPSLLGTVEELIDFVTAAN